MTRKIFVLEEKDNTVYRYYYFKSRRLRRKFYMLNFMLDCNEHFESWCEAHSYKHNFITWRKYIREIQPEDNYKMFSIRIKLDEVIFSDLLVYKGNSKFTDNIFYEEYRINKTPYKNKK